MISASRRVLASLLENAADVVGNVGIRLSDVLVDMAVEVMPAKPAKKAKPSPAEIAAKQEPAWWNRVKW